MKKTITLANIIWNELDTPFSIDFNDIYFSNKDALAETLYVFIEGNNLPERFIQHTTATLTIGETGFGSGLNFLVLWQQFLSFRQQYPNHPLKQLNFVSIEKFPLAIDDVIKIHQYYPSLSLLANQLQLHWPQAYYGKQNIQLDSITLTLFYCDISEYSYFLQQNDFYIDAWFFDGFSPAQNSDMWSANLFAQLYRQTNPKGTFATFTAAGYVKRNLVTAGFNVAKRKGFGIKREMLIGIKQ